jgi:hypothetical protein
MTTSDALELIKSCDAAFLEIPLNQIHFSDYLPEHFMTVTDANEESFTVRHTETAHRRVLSRSVVPMGTYNRVTTRYKVVPSRSWDETYTYAELPEVHVVWAPACMLLLGVLGPTTWGLQIQAEELRTRTDKLHGVLLRMTTADVWKSITPFWIFGLNLLETEQERVTETLMFMRARAKQHTSS